MLEFLRRFTLCQNFYSFCLSFRVTLPKGLMKGNFGWEIMSDPKEKKENTRSDIFSIDLDSSGVIPGVTQLINPKLLAEKAAAAERKAAQTKSSVHSTAQPVAIQAITPEIAVEISEQPAVIQATPAPVQSIVQSAAQTTATSLRELGVFLELQFTHQSGQPTFSKWVGHKNSSFEPWQNEFFSKFKIAPEVLGLTENFHEFGPQHLWVLDAFGASEHQFVQVIQLQTEYRVLISAHSLQAQKTVVMDLLSGKNHEISDSIEIDLSA